MEEGSLSLDTVFNDRIAIDKESLADVGDSILVKQSARGPIVTIEASAGGTIWELVRHPNLIKNIRPEGVVAIEGWHCCRLRPHEPEQRPRVDPAEWPFQVRRVRDKLFSFSCGLPKYFGSAAKGREAAPHCDLCRP